MPDSVIYKQVESEEVTVSSTAIGLTAAKYANAMFAVMRVEDANIRFDCVNTPTATSGFLEKDGGTPFEVWGENDLAGFQAIRTANTNAKLTVLYFAIEGRYTFNL